MISVVLSVVGCCCLVANDLGIELTSPALVGRFITTEPPGKPNTFCQGRPQQNKTNFRVNLKNQIANEHGLASKPTPQDLWIQDEV